MKEVLVDSDVILDFFLDRKPFSKSASELFSYCENGRLTVYITPVILSNLYYILRRLSNHQTVLERLGKLLKLTTILQMDQEVVFKAFNSDFKDFEDALQNFSAEANKAISCIITRNIKDYDTSRIAVMTPDDFLAMFKSEC